MAPSSGGLQDTTRGEAPALAQPAHTTVCTLFIQHRASSGSSSGNVDSSVATAGLIPRGSAWDTGFLVLVQRVLGVGSDGVWPHEKPGKYLRYSQVISPKSNKVYLYGMA